MVMSSSLMRRVNRENLPSSRCNRKQGASIRKFKSNGCSADFCHFSNNLGRYSSITAIIFEVKHRGGTVTCKPSGLVRMLMFRAVIRVRMMIWPKSLSGMILLVAIKRGGVWIETRRRFLKTRSCFFENDFAFLFLDYYLAAFRV